MKFGRLSLGAFILLASAPLLKAEPVPALPSWLEEFSTNVERMAMQEPADYGKWRSGRANPTSELLEAFREQAEGLGWQQTCALAGAWKETLLTHNDRLDAAFRTASEEEAELVEPTVISATAGIFGEGYLLARTTIVEHPGSAGFVLDQASIGMAVSFLKLASQPCKTSMATATLRSTGEEGRDADPHGLLTYLGAAAAAAASDRGAPPPVEPVFTQDLGRAGKDTGLLYSETGIDLDLERPEWAGTSGSDPGDGGEPHPAGGWETEDTAFRLANGMVPASFRARHEFDWAVSTSLRLLTERLEEDRSVRKAHLAGTRFLQNLLETRYHSGHDNLVSRLCSLPVPVKLTLADFVIEEDNSFSLEDCRLDELTILNGRIAGDMRLSSSTIAGDLLIRDLVTGGDLYLGGLSAGRIDIENLRPVEQIHYAEGGALEWKSRSGVIRAFDLRAERGLGLFKVQAASVFLGRFEGSELRLTDVAVDNDVNLWGSRIGWTFISRGVDIGGQLQAFYATIDRMEIGYQTSAVDRIRIAHLNMPHSRFMGRLFINKLISDKVNLEIGQANILQISCSEISEWIDLTGFQVSDAILLERNAIGVVYAGGTSGKLFQISSDKHDAALLDQSDSALAQCGRHSTINRLNLAQSKFDQALLTGTMSQEIFANQAQIGVLSFNDRRGQLGAGAIMNLRNSSIGLLALGPQTLAPDADGLFPALEIDGAQIRQVRHLEPDLDEWHRELDRFERRSDNQEDSLVQLYMGQILPATGVGGTNDQDRAAYSGTVYRMLRNSALEMGYPALEKRIAILQNQHYTSYVRDFSTPTWLFYKLGGVVNSFGYDNGKGIMILGLIWLTGFLILSSESWIWWGRNLIARLVSFISRDQAVRIAPPLPRPKLQLSGLFLSIDRTVPSLALDNSFSDPRRAVLANQPNDMRRTGRDPSGKREARTSILVVSLYIQRLVAFVVIMIMIGGVFNLFQ